MKTITLPYWGQVTGLVSNPRNKDSRSLFITRQSQSTAKTSVIETSSVLYILDSLYNNYNNSEPFSLSSTALPCAMQAIVQTDDVVIMLGENGHLYQTDWHAKKVTQVSTRSLLAAATELSTTLSTEFSILSRDTVHDVTSLIYPVAVAILPNTAADNANYCNQSKHSHTLAILYPQHIVLSRYQNGGYENSSDSFSIHPLTDVTTINNAPHTTSHSSNPATALAVSSDGTWLVIGDTLGFVSSYQLTTALTGLSLSSRQQIHQGQVTALCFEPVSQHFFSAGADKRLYRTHVQGELHPIDRAKSSQHSQMITALCVSDTRLFSASDDNSIKSWAFDKGQPNTCKDDLVKTCQLSLVSYDEQLALIAIGSDTSLRFVPIDGATNKLLPVAYIIKDGYQRILHLLSAASDEAAFKEALALLHAQADNQTLDIVQGLLSDSRANLSASRALELIHWIASTDLDNTTAILEQQLNAVHSSQVRLAAFHALAEKSHSSSRPLQYLEKAIGSQYEEVVAVAIQGYLKVALQDSDRQRRILPILQNALSHKLPHIRKQALASLETLLPNDSPRADLLALECHYPDMIQAGLIRLYQRDMLGSLEVTRQLMLLQADGNMEVRQTAFYVAVLSQPKLREALQQQADAQGNTPLLRTLSDFDDFNLRRGTLLESTADHQKQSDYSGNQAGKPSLQLGLSTQDFVTQTDSAKAVTTSKNAYNAKNSDANSVNLEIRQHLSNETLEPLLQGLSNRYEDISFRAAYALACLHDSRAFGTLVRLIPHNNDASIRAGVASALGTLAMDDAKAVLPALLNDKDAGVRQVAMRAFGQLADKLSWVAAGFDSVHQDIHEQALAIFLTQVLGKNSQKGKDHKVTTKNAPTAADQIALTQILQQALNNPFTSIRLEVVKVLLNRELKPSTPTAIDQSPTIQRLQQSLYEDVHQVAIEEWQRTLLESQASAQTLKATHDAQNLTQASLTLLLADNFSSIRKQAFAIALKNRKAIPFAVLMLAALASPFIDIKKLALSTLQAKADTSQLKTLLPALLTLLSDDSIEVRQQTLEVALALSDLQPVSLAFNPDHTIHNDDHNEALIRAALDSAYPDIQLSVAQLLASQQASQNAAHSDTNNKNDKRAYAVFERYLSAPMPTTAKDSADYKQWHDHVSRALAGLAKLSNPTEYQALDWYAKYLNHPDANFSTLAPNLMFIATNVVTNIISNIISNIATKSAHTHEPTDDPINANAMDILAKWQKDERPLIRQSASLALAVCGDNRGQYFFNPNHGAMADSHKYNAFKELATPLSPVQWLQARQGLGINHATQLQPLFESETYVFAARVVLIFNDLCAYETHTDQTTSSENKPSRLIEALSFVDNETAVVYAHILARYPKHVDESADTVQDMQPLMQPLWHYLSDYLSRKVSTVLSAHPAVVTSMTHDSAAQTKHTQAEVNSSVRSAILTAVSAPVLQQLAMLSNNQQPSIKAQALGVIGHLSEFLACSAYDTDSEVLSALQQWQRRLHALIVAQSNALPQIDTGAATKTTITLKPLPSNLAYPYQALAFGAWLGVIHADKACNDYDASDSSTEQAIRGLLWLADNNNSHDPTDLLTPVVIAPSLDWIDSVSRALLPLLGHHSFDTRKLVWACLYQLEMCTQKLAEYAMSTSHADMVKQGLHLLLSTIESKHTTDSDLNSPANQQLIQLLKTNNRRLAEETYQILKQRLGHLPASLLALDSYSVALVYQVVNEWQQVIVTPLPPQQPVLAEDCRQNKLTFLRQASTHDEPEVRQIALTQLLDFHELLFADNVVVEALFTLWREAKTAYEQTNVLALISRILQIYQRFNHSEKGLSELITANLAPDSAISIDSIKAVADSTYSRLLGLLDSADLKMHKAQVYKNIANLRNPQLANPLLQRLQQSFEPQRYPVKKDERPQIFDSLVTISGYDQPIENYNDENYGNKNYCDDHENSREYTDERWLQRQYPRHPQVLLSLFTTLMSYGDYEHAVQLLPSQAWAQDPKDKALSIAIDNALARAYEQLPSQYTCKLVETLSYRADKRDGDLSTLQKALFHKEADVPFLAAEALAKRGQTQGLHILMASIDYNADGALRRRSVLALGKLMASSRQAASAAESSHQDSNAHIHRLYKAYDKLITLAEDSEHYLQDVASEALGRLAGHSTKSTDKASNSSADFEHSAHIFELLKAKLTDPTLAPYNPAIIHWLNGLRWLNTYQAWEQIRQYIARFIKQDLFFAPQTHAIYLLQFADNPANKDMLLTLLKHRHIDYDAQLTAYSAAQKLWGHEATTVYPYDWAVIQNGDTFAAETDYLSIKRIVNNSSIDELTTFISEYGLQLPASSLQALQNAILAKPNMPTPALMALLTDNRASVQDIALSYLTQYPNEYLQQQANAMFAALQQCFDVASKHWQTLIDTVTHSPTTIEDEKWMHSVEQVTTTIAQIIWLKMRHIPITTDQNTLKPLLSIVHWLSATHNLCMVTSITILAAAQDKWWQKMLLALLAKPLNETSLLVPLVPALSALLITELDRPAPPLSHSNQAYLTTLLARIQANTDHNQPPVHTSARPPNSNQQLLQWLKDNNAAALYQCANSASTDTALRVRAIEALGQLHQPQIERWLTSLMQNNDQNNIENHSENNNDSDIQNLAYKVLRRWQRAQVLAQKKRPSTFASMDIISSQRQFEGDNK